jgi:hypothetical protein
MFMSVPFENGKEKAPYGGESASIRKKLCGLRFEALGTLPTDVKALLTALCSVAIQNRLKG